MDSNGFDPHAIRERNRGILQPAAQNRQAEAGPTGWAGWEIKT
jgi:hypothetical protein